MHARLGSHPWTTSSNRKSAMLIIFEQPVLGLINSEMVCYRDYTHIYHTFSLKKRLGPVDLGLF